jgi:hypothetical protein
MPRLTTIHSHRAKVPAAAAAFFHIERDPVVGPWPMIEQTFTALRGWRAYPHRKRISGNVVRQLGREGVTHVALRCGRRRADFTIEELLRQSVKRKACDEPVAGMTGTERYGTIRP